MADGLEGQVPFQRDENGRLITPEGYLSFDGGSADMCLVKIEHAPQNLVLAELLKFVKKIDRTLDVICGGVS